MINFEGFKNFAAFSKVSVLIATSFTSYSTTAVHANVGHGLCT